MFSTYNQNIVGKIISDLNKIRWENYLVTPPAFTDNEHYKLVFVSYRNYATCYIHEKSVFWNGFGETLYSLKSPTNYHLMVLNWNELYKSTNLN